MIDLHTHTIHTDGDLTTEEVLIEAEKNNIEILSFADHNNINAYDDLKDSRVRNLFSGKMIAGCELEFQKDGRLFDMLGYGFDLDKLKETEIIKEGMIHSTVEGQTKILNQLKSVCDDLGIKYSDNLIIKTANNMANDVLLDDILTHIENKEILDKMGIIDRTTFYRQHMCEPKSPFYIDQTEGKYDVSYVVNVIRKSGGKAFLAHPFVYKLPNLKEFLDELVSNNLLDGIECFHRKHDEDQIKWVVNYCDEHHLLKSGGSDKHTNDHMIGHANRNKIEIKEELINDWINNIELL